MPPPRLAAIHAALAVLVALLCLAPAGRVARADTPGDFDFYVLSLSWSPTYCEDRGRSDRIQCGGRPYAFVVHGLWPQYERGYPQDCPSSQPTGVSRRTVDGMLELMPSPGLIRHEWQTHGLCSGLNQPSYFDLIRRARAAVTIPDRFVDVEDYLTTSPREIERDFLAANPGLNASGIAVTCDSRRLKEVRICMTKGLQFRPCPEVDRDACRRDRVVLPPVR
jgi:ribonuclease T2